MLQWRPGLLPYCATTDATQFHEQVVATSSLTQTLSDFGRLQLQARPHRSPNPSCARVGPPRPVQPCARGDAASDRLHRAQAEWLRPELDFARSNLSVAIHAADVDLVSSRALTMLCRRQAA